MDIGESYIVAARWMWSTRSTAAMVPRFLQAIRSQCRGQQSVPGITSPRVARDHGPAVVHGLAWPVRGLPTAAGE